MKSCIINIQNMNRYKEKQILKRYKELIPYVPNMHDMRTILLCMYQLTPTWFEHYIAWYLKEVEKYYKVHVNWGIHDKWLDIICKNSDSYAVVQCKKYETQNVSVKDILYFDRCIKPIIPEQKKNLTKYFITTNWCNPQSKEVAKELGIKLWDYHKIINDVQKHYPIEKFLHIHKGNSNLVVQKYMLAWLEKELSKSSHYWTVEKEFAIVWRNKTIAHAY